MALVLLLVSAACTPAKDAVYEVYEDYMYIDPETGEFVDPDTFVPNIEEEEEEEVEEEVEEDENAVKAPITINVADYGAKGDGVTDDAKAIYDACMALAQGGKGSKLVFGKNKTYYAADNGGVSSKVMILRSLADDVVIEGNGSTILADGELTYLSISGTKGLTFKELSFNRKTTAHFVGTVVYKEEYVETNIDGKQTPRGFVEVIADRDIGFSEEEYVPIGDAIFAFVPDSNLNGQRFYCYMEKLTTVNAAERRYRFYADVAKNQLGTKNNFNKLEAGSKIIIPTPNVGHYLQDAVFIGSSSDLTMKDVNVHNIPRFGFHINGNTGKILFDNVDLVPAPNEPAVFVSWRDGFHCKSNREAITWKDCDAVGLGDDIINISANKMYVNKVYASKDTPLIDGKKYPDQISCTFSQSSSGYGTVNVGDNIVIYDVDTGKLLANTTIKKVINEKENRYVLAEPIKGLKAGNNIKVYFDNHAAPNSQLINCNFEGTLRFRGAGGVATNCKLKLYAMMMYPEKNVEGPIPHDTIFRNCDFTGTRNLGLRIYASDNGLGFNGANDVWSEGRYRLENIVFENCIGLTASMFENYVNNTNPNSVDYITITPALQ